MVFDLNKQYQDRIEYLQNKISEQQDEISQLKTLIELLSYSKEYDC